MPSNDEGSPRQTLAVQGSSLLSVNALQVSTLGIFLLGYLFCHLRTKVLLGAGEVGLLASILELWPHLKHLVALFVHISIPSQGLRVTAGEPGGVPAR